MKNENIRRITRIALLTAVISALSQLAVPAPSGVPFTLQTFAVALAGFLLGAEDGFLAALCYVLLGAVGAPVYAQFRGGPQMLVGMTGGFLLGFLPMAALCGAGARMARKTAGGWKAALAAAGCGMFGVLACHIPGVAQFSLVTKTSVPTSFTLVSLPYLLKDALSVFAAYLLSVPVVRRVPGLGGR